MPDTRNNWTWVDKCATGGWMCGSICFWQMKWNYEVFCLLVGGWGFGTICFWQTKHIMHLVAGGWIWQCLLLAGHVMNYGGEVTFTQKVTWGLVILIYQIHIATRVAVCGNLDLSCFWCAHQVWRLLDNFTFQGYNYNVPKICLRCPSCACGWCYQLCPDIYHYHLFVSNLLTTIELCRQAMCIIKLPGTLWRLQGIMESCTQLCSQ